MQFTVNQTWAQTNEIRSESNLSKPNPTKYNCDRNFFIENKSQWPSEVLFMTQTYGMNAWITKDGVVYDFNKSTQNLNIEIMDKRRIGDSVEVLISGTSKLIAFNSSFDNNRISIQLNSLPANYSGSIEKCTFRKNTGLIVPYTPLDKPLNGIRIYNCRNVTIGNQTNAVNGNLFQNVWNGIWIFSYSSNGSNNVSRSVNLYNNRFIDISGGPNLWSGGNSFYSSSTGCAIWTKHAGMNYWNAGKLVKITGTSPTVNFENCNKNAIINGYGMDARNTTSNDCNVGFVNAQNGQVCYAYSNTLNNVMLGIYKIGNERTFTSPNQYGFIASGNNITLAPYPITNQGISTGIRSQYVTSNTGNTLMNGNSIYLPMEKDAYAISLENGAKDRIVENYIFYTTVNSTSLNIPPSLRGANISNSNSTVIFKNTFTGQANSFLNNVNASGIFIDGQNSTLADISCNVVDNLQYGIFTRGNQTTGYDMIKGNTLNTQRCGLCFDYLGSEGAFGDIGRKVATPYYAYDANNHFNGNNQLHRVYRFSPSTTLSNPVTLDNIYTQISNLNEAIPDSWSSNPIGDKRYKIQNLSLFTNIFDISTSCSGIANFNSGYDPVYDLALRIATESTEYVEFNEEAQWLDERMLMEWLVENPTILTDYPVLSDFYLEENNAILNDLAEVERNINLLSNEDLLNYETQWEITYQSSSTANDTLNTTEYFVQNEQYVNQQYLWVLKHDIEDMLQEDKDAIMDIAASCPYIVGRAVYRARALANMILPNMYYDDKTVCNALGIYKGGNSPYQYALDILNGHGSFQRSTNFNIYPNPSDDNVNIAYELDRGNLAQLEIIDVLGRKRLVVELSSMVNIATISTNALEHGVYVYRFIINGVLSNNGKLLVN